MRYLIYDTHYPKPIQSCHSKAEILGPIPDLYNHAIAKQISHSPPWQTSPRQLAAQSMKHSLEGSGSSRHSSPEKPPSLFTVSPRQDPFTSSGSEGSDDGFDLYPGIPRGFVPIRAQDMMEASFAVLPEENTDEHWLVGVGSFWFCLTYLVVQFCYKFHVPPPC